MRHFLVVLLLAFPLVAESPAPVLRGDELEQIQSLESLRLELTKRRETAEKRLAEARQELFIARFAEEQAAKVVSEWLIGKSPDPERCRGVDAAGRWQCAPEVSETAKDGVE